GEVGAQRGESGSHVVLLSGASAVAPLGGPHPPEVEAERGDPGLRGDLHGADHHRVVHVAPVERMGMAHDQAGPGPQALRAAPLPPSVGGGRPPGARPAPPPPRPSPPPPFGNTGAGSPVKKFSYSPAAMKNLACLWIRPRVERYVDGALRTGTARRVERH